MGKHQDLTGLRFGKLVVQEYYDYTSYRKHRWLCKCDCGNTCIVQSAHLRSGAIYSCGCEKIKKIRKANTKHGLVHTRLYTTFHSMKARCLNKNNKNYSRYGGRGIKICDEWLADFMNFYTWAINNGYKEGLTIDRINNDGNYEPNNCRWVGADVQMRNYSRNKFITINNETHCIADWADILGINVHTIYSRYQRGKNIVTGKGI